MTMTGHDFDADTAATAEGAGVYALTLSDRWNALGGVVNGGYLIATCLRALRAELAYSDPLVATAHYLRAGTPGEEASISTEMVRTGRRLATGQATLSQRGGEVVRVLASFTDLGSADGHTLVRNSAPALPDPIGCTNPLEGMTMPGVTIAERVEVRMPEVPGWWRGEPGGDLDAEFWMRFSDGREPDLLSLALFVDATAPAVLDLGVAGSSTMELTVHLRAAPAPGWLACRVSTRHVMSGYHEEDFEIWDSTGTLVAQSRQLALLP